MDFKKQLSDAYDNIQRPVPIDPDKDLALYNENISIMVDYIKSRLIFVTETPSQKGVKKAGFLGTKKKAEYTFYYSVWKDSNPSRPMLEAKSYVVDHDYGIDYTHWLLKDISAWIKMYQDLKPILEKEGIKMKAQKMSSEDRRFNPRSDTATHYITFSCIF